MPKYRRDQKILRNVAAELSPQRFANRRRRDQGQIDQIRIDRIKAFARLDQHLEAVLQMATSRFDIAREAERAAASASFCKCTSSILLM